MFELFDAEQILEDEGTGNTSREDTGIEETTKQTTPGSAMQELETDGRILSNINPRVRDGLKSD